MTSYAEMQHEKLYNAPQVERYSKNWRDEAPLYNRNGDRTLDRYPFEAEHSGEKRFSPSLQGSRTWDYERELYNEPYSNEALPRNSYLTEHRDMRPLQNSNEDSSFIPREKVFSRNGSAFHVPRPYSKDRREEENLYENGMLNGYSLPSFRSFEDSHPNYRLHKDLKTEERFDENEDRLKKHESYDSDYSQLNGSGGDHGNRTRQTYTKFVSMIPTWNKFERERSLPDRIELRMCGVPPKEAAKRSFSIPDLYRVKFRPVPYINGSEYVDEVFRSTDDIDAYMSAPEFETEFDYKYDHDNQHLHYHSPKHEHLKEMYISQYTHYFDLEPGTPRSHIAGWKVDIEPQGIPHKKSRMCVLKNPLISRRKQRAERPKSAPPSFSNRFRDVEPADEDVFTADQIAVQESSVVLQSARPSSPPDRRASLDNMSDRFGEMTIDSEPLDYPDEGSSFGYAPSDDTSDTSSAFGISGRSLQPQRFTMSQPRLIPISAEYPGIRNLEKMRKKRQSMGSSSSGSISADMPSPTTSEQQDKYGSCFALISQNPKSQTLPEERKQEKKQPRQTRYYTLE